MATIPLPALHLNPPQQGPGPLEQYGQLMAMQNAGLQHQNLLQQQQAGAIQLQEAQQAQKDQLAFRSAMQDPSNQGKTIGDVADALAHSGNISQQGWVQAKKADVEQRQALATLDKDQLANASAAHAQTQQLYNNVMNMPDDQLAQNWSQIAQQYDAIPGNQKIPLDPNRPLSKDQLKQFGPMISMQEAYLQDEQKKRQTRAETEKNTAQAAEANANAAKTLQQMQYGPAGEFAKAKYQFILQKAASGQPLSPDEMNYARGFEASEAKNTTQSDTLGVTSNNASRPAGLASVLRGQPAPQSGPTAPAPAGAPLLPHANLPSNNPTSPVNVKNSLVDMIGQYKETPALLGRLIAKHPDMLAAVQQKYPDWDQTTYNAKNKLISDYTSGKDSQSINAMNTAVGHLAALDEAATALHNGNIQALNGIANKLGVQFGADPATTYNLIVHRVGPEIASSYIPGGGGEGERQATAADFSSSMSPQQIHNNVAASINLFRSKVAALENQYKQTVGRDDFQQKFFTPEARAAFQKYGAQGGSSGGGTVTRYKIVNGQLVPQ